MPHYLSSPHRSEGGRHPPSTAHPSLCPAFSWLHISSLAGLGTQIPRDPPEARGPETAPNKTATMEPPGLVPCSAGFLREGGFLCVCLCDKTVINKV